jgi:hypothetical protein
LADALCRQLGFVAPKPQPGEKEAAIIGGFETHRALGGRNRVFHLVVQFVAPATMSLQLCTALCSAGERNRSGIPDDRLLEMTAPESAPPPQVRNLLARHGIVTHPPQVIKQGCGLFIEGVSVQGLGHSPPFRR